MVAPTIVALLAAIGPLAVAGRPHPAAAFAPRPSGPIPPPRRAAASTLPPPTGPVPVGRSARRVAPLAAGEGGDDGGGAAASRPRDAARRGILRRAASAAASAAALVPATRSPAVAADGETEDEIRVLVTKADLQRARGGFGLELGGAKPRRDARAVVVKSVAPGSLAEALGIPPGWVLVRLNGADTLCADPASVSSYFSKVVESTLGSPKDLSVIMKFWSPSKFQSDVDDLPKDVLYCTGLGLFN